MCAMAMARAGAHSHALGDETSSDLTLLLQVNELFLFSITSESMRKESAAPCDCAAAVSRSSAARELSEMSGLRNERYSNESVLKVHAAVLSSASGFFRDFMTSCRASPRQMCSDCGGPERTVVVFKLRVREFEAAHCVVRYMYTNQLPTNNGRVPDGMLLIWMIKVSKNTIIDR